MPLILVLIVNVLLGWIAIPVTTTQDGQGQAGIVVQYNEGRVASYCVNLLAEGMTSYEALLSTGIELETLVEANGVAVCKISQVGCQSSNCFCQSPPDYWSFWQLKDGVWSYATLGAARSELHPGDVDGWAWGEGTPPDAIEFSEICNAEKQQGMAVEYSTVNPSVPQLQTPESPQTASNNGKAAGYLVFLGTVILLGFTLFILFIRH
jgi:hypothetical protein